MHESEDACIPVHVHACACRWMTASIILFVIHRCMGCTRWRFIGYLQRVAWLFRCTDVHPSRWFASPWVMRGSVKEWRWVGLEETLLHRSLSKVHVPLVFIGSRTCRVSNVSIYQHMPFPNGQSSTIHTIRCLWEECLMIALLCSIISTNHIQFFQE